MAVLLCVYVREGKVKEVCLAHEASQSSALHIQLSLWRGEGKTRERTNPRGQMLATLVNAHLGGTPVPRDEGTVGA